MTGTFLMNSKQEVTMCVLMCTLLTVEEQVCQVLGFFLIPAYT